MRWDIDGRHVPHQEWSRFVSAGGLNWHVQETGPADAPVLLVNDRTMCSFMTDDKLDQLVDGLREAEKS